jgi:Glycosyl hydrolases family 16/FG-GAP-like repeat
VSQAFHTYGVRWTPNNVVWYLDGSPIYQQPGHAPPKDMHVIANHAIHPWAPYPVESDFPASFEIDYIRVFRSLDKEMLWRWGNGGAGKLDWWNMSTGDTYVAGDFDGDGRDELLATSAATGYAHLMKYGSAWSTPWANDGSHVIDVWHLNPGDQLVAGDFDGDGRDELLATSAATGYAHLMKYGSGSWNTLWTNLGNHAIHWWLLNPGDQLLARDFDGDGRDELLAVSTGGWSQLMPYAASAWSTPWSNEGAWTIHLWHIRSSDRYLTGDFDPQHAGAELLGLSQNGWAHVMGYDPLPLH